MFESRPWEDSDLQLFQVQEKFNAYVSFLLDGELAEAHPELAGKNARIELRCAEMPEGRALDLLNAIHDQLALQEIRVEVIAGSEGLPVGANARLWHGAGSVSVRSCAGKRLEFQRTSSTGVGRQFFASAQKLQLDQELRFEQFAAHLLDQRCGGRRRAAGREQVVD